MKELINIVNSKFQAVIDELKSQKTTLEDKLKQVIEDIDKKVIVASKYKEDVEESNNTISDLEKEIESLKKDLQELHDKFEASGFKAIVEAGNKEINGKIIENNTKISEQKENIKRYQDEVQNLKDELTTLKDSKHSLEKELNNTTIALNYYSTRIDELTIYAIENSDKLSDYVKTKEQAETTDEEEDFVNKDIDGEIFKEIDEISAGNKELSEEELNELLNTKYNEDEEEEDEEEELSKTQMLDDVISKTEEIIKSAKDEDEFLSLLDDDKETETLEEPKEEKTEEPVEEEIKEIKAEEPTEEIEEIKVEDVKPEEDEIEEIETIPEETKEEEIEEIVHQEETKEEVKDDVMSNLTTVSLDSIVNTTSSKVEANDEVKDTIEKLGLKYDKFDDKISKLSHIDYDNAVRIIDCLDLHFIDTDNIYKNPSILVTMRPDVLDKVLDLLELVGCAPSTFNYIFKYLDKIDVNKLEEKAKTKTDSVITLLYDVIHSVDIKNISEVMGLSEEGAKMLESKLDAKDYNVMCGFSDVVKANYDILNNYHINDINKCFTEHPKRFLLNPDIFETILDKYDPQDLVRCINKNVAVIDRL